MPVPVPCASAACALCLCHLRLGILYSAVLRTAVPLPLSPCVASVSLRRVSVSVSVLPLLPVSPALVPLYYAACAAFACASVLPLMPALCLCLCVASAACLCVSTACILPFCVLPPVASVPRRPSHVTPTQAAP